MPRMKMNNNNEKVKTEIPREDSLKNLQDHFPFGKSDFYRQFKYLIKFEGIFPASSYWLKSVAVFVLPIALQIALEQRRHQVL